MRPATIETLAGTTIRFTFVNSGATAAPISSALLTASDTLVSSKQATSSGGGFYYADMMIPSSGPLWLVNEWRSFIAPNSYCDRQFVRVRTLTVG